MCLIVLNWIDTTSMCWIVWSAVLQKNMWCRCRQCMYDMPCLMYFHTKFDMTCCMPYFIDLCQNFHMLYANFDVFGNIIGLWCAKIFACYTKTLSCCVNFNTCCMIIVMWYVKITCCITRVWFLLYTQKIPVQIRIIMILHKVPSIMLS